MRKLLQAGLLLLGALVFIAPAFSQTPALEKPKLTLAVGGKSLFYYLPLIIAERLSYFKDEGLKVEIVDFAGGAKALQALVGGSADVVSGSFEHTIHMQAKGIPITAVVLQGRYAGIVLGLSKVKAAQYKSPKDLKGMKIGVTAPGSSTNMFVNNLLAKEGLAPDAVSIIGVGAGAGAVAAMQKGELDGIANLDPVITKLKTTGDIVVVADSRTIKGMKEIYGGDYAAGCLYVHADFPKQYPNMTQALVNAMVRALKWIKQATPEQIVATVPEDYYLGDKALYRAALEQNLESYSPDGQISMAAVNNVYKVLAAFDPTVQSAKIDLAKTHDNSFAAKAAQKYQ